MNYQIEDGIPMPETRGRHALRWPADKLEVGQSFLVPFTESTAARQCIKRHGEKTKKVFACRRMEDGVRIWRVA